MLLCPDMKRNAIQGVLGRAACLQTGMNRASQGGPEGFQHVGHPFLARKGLALYGRTALPTAAISVVHIEMGQRGAVLLWPQNNDKMKQHPVWSYTTLTNSPLRKRSQAASAFSVCNKRDHSRVPRVTSSI